MAKKNIQATEERFMSADLFSLINGTMTSEEFRSYWGEFEYYSMDATITNNEGDYIYVE